MATQSEPRPCSSKSAQAQAGFNQNQNFGDIRNLIGSFLQNLNGAVSSAVPRNESDVKSVSTTPNSYEIKLDVSKFTQDEISIRVEDNYIVIDAKQEEKQDEYGFIARQFSRRFVLPEGILLEKMYSEINPDKVLVISAPRLVPEVSPTNERSIPINIDRSGFGLD